MKKEKIEINIPEEDSSKDKNIEPLEWKGFVRKIASFRFVALIVLIATGLGVGLLCVKMFDKRAVDKVKPNIETSLVQIDRDWISCLKGDEEIAQLKILQKDSVKSADFESETALKAALVDRVATKEEDRKLLIEGIARLIDVYREEPELVILSLNNTIAKEKKLSNLRSEQRYFILKNELLLKSDVSALKQSKKIWKRHYPHPQVFLFKNKTTK
mgnify:CR=1 FL=1